MTSHLISLLALLLLSACATPNVLPLAGGGVKTHGLKVIGLLPGGGASGDAVRNELGARGLNVLPASTMSVFLNRHALNDVNLATEKGRAVLKREGVDGLLAVRESVLVGNEPHRISAHIESTATGKRLAGVTWQPSPLRNNCIATPQEQGNTKHAGACEIAEALLKQLGD